MDEMRLSSQEGRGQATVRTSILQILQGVCKHCTTTYQVWTLLSHRQSLVKHHLGRAGLSVKQEQPRGLYRNDGIEMSLLPASSSSRPRESRAPPSILFIAKSVLIHAEQVSPSATTTTAIKANGNGGSFMKGEGGRATAKVKDRPKGQP